jgi:hypothetical protein
VPVPFTVHSNRDFYQFPDSLRPACPAQLVTLRENFRKKISKTRFQMKRSALSFLLVFLFGHAVFGQIGGRQAFFELQFGAGPTFMLTDVGGTGYGGNLEVTGKYRLHQHIALKASLGGVFGTGSNEIQYYTILAELTGQVEFYILKEGKGYGKGGHVGYKPRVRPYLYAGGGPTFFFPSHIQDNAQPLPDFNHYTVILVGGAGFLYRVNADIFWGMQVGPRITTTDFLDGYAPETSSGHDNYISAQVLLLYRF